jgi:hypothetical protein
MRHVSKIEFSSTSGRTNCNCHNLTVRAIKMCESSLDWFALGVSLEKNPHSTCAVKRRWSTAGGSPARELGSLHPEAIGAAVEKTKPSEPPV